MDSSINQDRFFLDFLLAVTVLIIKNQITLYFFLILQICRNGKIQLNYEWSFWWPQKFGVYRWFSNMAIIAPFWATTDEYLAFKAGYSKVYYHVYSQIRQNTVQSQTSNMLAMASQHVKLYDKSGKFTNFKATWVLVVTWENICPYVYYPYWYYYWYNWGLPELNCDWVSGRTSLWPHKGSTHVMVL